MLINPIDSLDTILPPAAERALGELADHDRAIFALRLERSREDLMGPLRQLYGHRDDFAAFADALITRLAAAWAARPAELKLLDLKRDLEPDWFLRETMVGYVFYLDRFNGNLAGVLDRLDYLTGLGVTYVHFMPCLMPRPGDNDGGYSVMDYRRIDPRFGTMADLERVTAALRRRGISVCMDLVLNHTAKEHEWAEKARAGDPDYQAYYWMFSDRDLPDRYERSLLEVFPENAPGNFTWYDDLGQWVWTTFNEHQWDLNWSNPQVFLEIIDIMLFLANRGVEALRLDAVAFMWKRMGTICQNEPEVHQILHALRAANRVAAASVIHKEEAIVSPKDLIPYLGEGLRSGKEGNLAYHNSLMVQFWSSLATRDTAMMTHVLRTHFPTLFVNATWATYLRCHDDIGWAVTDEDAGAVGVSGAAHRAFLADFYAGTFPGSFARGGVFQSNPDTGDQRTVGTCASLCGLEAALADGDAEAVDRAIQRILMGHALIASFGGLPLIYMGDELGLTNDLDYLADGDKAADSRWMHRPAMDWARAARRKTVGTIENRIHGGVWHILMRRKATRHLHAETPTEIRDCGVDGVFAFRRPSPRGVLVAFFNFAEDWRDVPRGFAEAAGAVEFVDQLSESAVATTNGVIALPHCARLWLT